MTALADLRTLAEQRIAWAREGSAHTEEELIALLADALEEVLPSLKVAEAAQTKAHEFDSGWDGDDGSGIHTYDPENAPRCGLCAALAGLGITAEEPQA